MRKVLELVRMNHELEKQRTARNGLVETKLCPRELWTPPPPSSLLTIQGKLKANKGDYKIVLYIAAFYIN
ncbi:Uncharacterized protein TCM_000866 [Theobroma cacao]|uniref:Uncharacterized protein n=1 Tax=Theobroma cacao TaxID=3641 RepID=A0A061DIS2_THECC|nr:Uncharacterized protein TCM_000866 [Theobroma cacao]